MAAMKNLVRGLTRLEDRLAPMDFARNPGQRLRVVVCRMGRTLCLETATCRRTFNADGFLSVAAHRARCAAEAQRAEAEQ